MNQREPGSDLVDSPQVSDCDCNGNGASETKASSCCCLSAREPQEPVHAAVLFYEAIEPYLILLSGLALAASFFHWTENFLPFDPSWLAILISGSPVFYRAFQVLRHGRISVDVLIGTAISATIVAEYMFPSSSGHHSYIFAGGEVAFIMALGHLLEEWTVSRARAGIENLVKMTPQTARRMVGEVESEIPASEVRQDDLLRVLPGETIPVDGEIVQGNSSVDQSLITGESLPVDRFVGDAVFGGTINRFGSFSMRATSVGEDSSLARMIRLVREAEQKKAPMERIADRWATWLVPAALITAVLVGLVTYGLLAPASGAAEEALRRAVTILVVFCPCSLVLATPTAVIAAIGNASHHGILIRSGEALERFARTDVLAFDKTGTLTVGEPQLMSSQPFDPRYDSNGLLALAASVETLSEHPIASCIVSAATEKGLELNQSSDFEMFPGEGISVQLVGIVEEDRVFVGNDRLLRRFEIEPSDFQKSQADLRFRQGETVVWVAVGDRVIGLLSIADSVRSTTKDSIRQIRDSGIDVVLLTGDNERAAKNIAEISGIAEVRSDLLPTGKVDIIEELARKGTHVGMVGDGLNDAPALKMAEVGIAMGKVGSDLAIDAADIVLIGDDIARLPFLIRLARKTKKTIIGNICLSMGINVIAIVLATTGVMGPVVGALVHNAGSVFVVLNASLLLNVRR